MEWMVIIGPVTGLLGVLGVVFNYSVIRPLNTAINNLNIAIGQMQKQLHEVDEKRQDMDKRLVNVESSVKYAHHRLDEIAQRLND